MDSIVRAMPDGPRFRASRRSKVSALRVSIAIAFLLANER